MFHYFALRFYVILFLYAFSFLCIFDFKRKETIDMLACEDVTADSEQHVVPQAPQRAVMLAAQEPDKALNARGPISCGEISSKGRGRKN